jgi:type II restriction/modification system DNA methylase subunit YeeA
VNINKLKAYAQAARREFIEAVTERAHFFGISANGVVPCEVKGDFTIINGSAFPRHVDEQRSALEEQVNRKGFSPVMEEVAYTWFNRCAAIRYMELHGFLSHGYRVLSHPEGNSIPEILEKAQHVELASLDKEEVIKLKMDGTKDEELYSKLLIAECNELSKAMPFLFEHVQDYTELLLPDNLLHSDSIIRKLVSEIEEEDWQEVEIIGWLYQFYISEKKDEVIGKVVKSEDIPSATQLFTPNWIVKYLVQNSLGTQWMRTYPGSSLKTRMEYYIEPAEQADEVNAKIKEFTPDTLNPEELTLLDPACGSGHILVEAYDLLKEIYLERGYRKLDIPELILTKNLYGLEIDDRAAQLAGFALIMKARTDDRSIFDRDIQPNIVSIQESKGIKSENEFEDLVNLFVHAKTFGSLIRVPDELANTLPEIRKKIEEGKKGLDKQDLWTGSQYYERLLCLVNQAEKMSRKYDAVVANPPYMGSKGMNVLVKKFVKDYFPDAKSDLFACFIERGCQLAKDHGHNAIVTMDSWMFLSSYTDLRESLLRDNSIESLVHIGWNCFPQGHTYNRGVALVMTNEKERDIGAYLNLSDVPATEDKNALFLSRLPDKDVLYCRSKDAFAAIPGSPLAYWISDKVCSLYAECELLSELASPKQGMATTDNAKYLRQWWEVCLSRVGFNLTSLQSANQTDHKWFPYNKGGSFRKWAGNHEYVVDWENDGEKIKADVARKYPYLNGNVGFVLKLTNPYFEQCLTWTATSSFYFGVRYSGPGMMFDVKGSSCFCEEKLLLPLLGFLSSHITARLLEALNPTIEFQNGNLKNLPISSSFHDPVFLCESRDVVRELVARSGRDWNSYERSWDFESLPILKASTEHTPTLESSYTAWITQNRDTIAEMKRLEEENNRLFIDAYGLQDELTPDVPIEQITLTVNPAYRYGGKLTEDELWTRFRQDAMEELVSYAIGCMMGRYSLGQKGLVYAHAGNDGFDHSKYKAFPADDDGILPITDKEWFDDDAPCRFFRFIETAWDKDKLEENLEFVADAIGRKTNESSRDSIRRYFVSGFFKDHLKTYKKRPIYWMFTSGKEKAFQALVYLHRYNEGTLSRMRTEYVLPLQGKITTRMEHLEKDKDHATSTSAANKIQKEIGRLRKQKEELLKFDENLHHYADKKISLDLDDGVKVNYGKFGDLLAEVKAITGKK